MRTPEFWSDDTILSRILLPLGALYAAATRQRLKRPARYRAPVPVICVGNVTAGGSGKTPVVQALAKRAIERGIAVHCLSRGYGGRLAGPVRVDAAIHSAKDVGDEPLLLASIAPTWVARDRVTGAQAAVAAGAQLIILDDGLQNPDLAYDASLLVIDGGFGFGNGQCIPAGPLREPVAVASLRVMAAVLIGDDITNCWAHLPSSLPVFPARIVAKDNHLQGKSVIGFAGLGRPEKFRQTLQDSGANIVGWSPFPDHHVFTRSDLKSLADEASLKQALLVTTEKDFVRLPARFQTIVTVLAVDLVPDDLNAWDTILNKVLR